jgi:hypothetical protein
MRVLHGIAHPAQQPYTLLNREAALVTVRRDRIAFDQFHREERSAIVMEASVEEPRDGGVIELGQNLPFATEAHRRVVAIEAASHELERDDLNELAIGALGPINDAHASAPELMDHTIRTDASTRVERTKLGAVSRRCHAQPCVGAILQEVACRGVCGEKLLDSVTEGGILAADAFEQRASFLDRKLQRLIEQRFETRPARFARLAVHQCTAAGNILPTPTSRTEDVTDDAFC